MLWSEIISEAHPPANRGARHVADLVKWSHESHGMLGAGLAGKAVRQVGILGGGLMGAAMAAAHLQHQVPVVLVDSSPEALAAAPLRVVDELSHAIPHDLAQGLVESHLRTSDDPAALGACDLVLETIVENLGSKLDVYRRIDPLLSDAAVVGSNTSTIPIRKLAAGFARPERFCGIHFFHPVAARPLVEVIRGEQSSDATIAAAVALACQINKVPIVVRDGPGFLVNRLLSPYFHEGLDLLLQGHAVEQIDRAATQFGMAVGPLQMMDEIGLDTALRGGLVMLEAFPDRIAGSPFLVALLKAGRQGRKSGAGFYRYSANGCSANGAAEPDPAVEPILSRWIDATQPPPADWIAPRLFLAVLLEATRMIEEGAVQNAGDIDLGMVYGLGFPVSRGGILCWADSIGAAQILRALEPLASVGPQFRPTGLLIEMAKTGRRFFEG